ncbi:MAG TPA: DUF3570 domain-containing protein [Polyangiaceae bacterium]|nr:DUF3570 domain-containing protein [Polyangiaceae bacterium]
MKRFRVAPFAVWAAALSPGWAFADENPHGQSGARPIPNQAPDAVENHGSGSKVVKAKAEMSAYTDTDAVNVFTPAVEGSIESPTAGWSASGSYLVDVVSAASVDIVSTASGHWTEVRHAGTLGAGYSPGGATVNVSGAVSREPDYLSLSGGGSVTLDLADKTVNPTFAYGYTHDTAGRSDTPFSVFSQTLQRHTITGALELILDPLTLVSFSVDGIFEVGDQTKPYRMLPIFAPSVAPNVARGATPEAVNALRLPARVAEHLPDSRNRFAISGRLAQRLSGSTFVLTERFYADDWGLVASTTDLRFVIDASRRTFVWTHLRGHFQSGVTFWQRAYVGYADGAPLSVPKWRTGDREMSPLNAGTFGAGIRVNVGPDTHPTEWSVVGQADVLLTAYSNALFIQNREGFLGVIQLEAEL